jgi:outer membrane lipoprotein-sorting protein
MFNRNKNGGGSDTARGGSVAELDASLAAVEAEPAAQLFQSTGAESRPNPAFVERLEAGLREQTVQKPAVRHARLGFGWPARRVALAAAVLVVALAVAGWAWLNQPASVSAAGILARASSMPGPGVQSLHVIYTGEEHESVGGPVTAGQYEGWFQAPTKYRVVSMLMAPGGAKQNSWFLSDGSSTWTYDSRPDEIQIQDPDPSDDYLMATSLGQIIQEATHGQYDAALQGSETILGRPAYVVELTAKQSAKNEVSGPQDPIARSRLWVDQQLYLPLQQYNWDAAGNLLARISMTHLDINPAIDPGLFTFVQPAGVPVRDMRQSTLWQNVAQQAGFKVFRPSPDSWLGAPDQIQYDAATRQVDATIPTQLADGTSVELLIDEVSAAGPLPALGDPVSIDLSDGQKLTGNLSVTGNVVTLGFDRDGTRIVISTTGGKKNYALVLKTAQSLVPVPLSR